MFSAFQAFAPLVPQTASAGAARIGDVPAATQAVRQLETLRDSIKGSRLDWWTDQIEIQRVAASAWLAFAEGRSPRRRGSQGVTQTVRTTRKKRLAVGLEKE